MAFSSVLPSVLMVVGGIYLASSSFNILSFLTFHFVPFRNSLKKYQRQPRAWGIVTGSSAGMGLGCAQELVSRGFGVIVLAHKEEEVNDAVATIKSEFKDASVEKIVLDATKASYTDIEAALAPFMNLPITILVNNVSVQTSTPLFTHFESYTPANISDSITVNNLFLCNITHILYSTLKRNGPSLIVNVSSGGHSVSLPWLTVYCGTKAFTETWSKCMSREVKELGDPIDSITIIPGDVRTQKNIYGVAPGSPTGREFAAMYLDRIGRAVKRGRMVIAPFWKHDLIFSFVRMLPDSVVGPVVTADVANRKRLEEEASKHQ